MAPGSQQHPASHCFLLTWACSRRRTTSSGMVSVSTQAALAAPMQPRRCGGVGRLPCRSRYALQQ